MDGSKQVCGTARFIARVELRQVHGAMYVPMTILPVWLLFNPPPPWMETKMYVVHAARFTA